MNWDDVEPFNEVLDLATFYEGLALMTPSKQSTNPFAPAKGKYAYDDSESSEEEKRVLKTPKEKLIALIKDNYSKIKDHIESKNYIGILEAFTEVIKNSEKIKKEFGFL